MITFGLIILQCFTLFGNSLADIFIIFHLEPVVLIDLNLDWYIYYLKDASISKIGHMKELPELPHHLSDDGKHFSDQKLPPG